MKRAHNLPDVPDETAVYIPPPCESDLATAVDDLGARHGSVWALTGPPGVGKSVLTARVLLYAYQSLEQVRCAGARCVPSHSDVATAGATLRPNDPTVVAIRPSTDSYGPFKEIVARLGTENSRFASLERHLQMHRWPTLGRVAYRVGTKIPVILLKEVVIPWKLVGVAADVLGEVHRQFQEEHGLSHSFEDALARMGFVPRLLSRIQRETQSGPVIIFVDDAHLLDQASCELLFHLGNVSAHNPLMLLLIYQERAARHYADATGHPLLSYVSHGVASRLVRRVQLAPWGSEQVAEYIQSRYPGAAIPPEFTAWLTAKTGGYPLFVSEALKFLEAEKHIKVEAGGGVRLARSVGDFKIPPTVEEVIRQQLNRVGKAIRDVVTTASVEGVRFHEEVLRRLTPPTDDQHLAGLLGAAEAYYDLVRSDPAAVGGPLGAVYHFAHGLIHDTAYSMMPERVRRELHRLVAQELEALAGRDATVYASEIAEHSERGGDALRAARYHCEAAEQSLALYDGAGARGRSLRALDLLEASGARPEHPSVYLRLRYTLARSLYRLGDWAAATSLLREVAMSAGPIGLHGVACDAWLLYAHLKSIERDLRDAERSAKRALTAALLSGEPGRHLAALIGLQRIYSKRPEAEKRRFYADTMFPGLRQVLDAARSKGERAIEARTLRWIGRLHRSLGEFDLARPLFLHALEIAQVLRDLDLVIEVHYALIDLEATVGDPDEAIQLYEETYGTAVALNADALQLSNLLLAYGERLKDMGRSETAKTRLSEALEHAEKAGLLEQQCLAHGLLANLFDLTGEPSREEQHHRAHYELARRLSDRGGMISGAVGMASCLARRGEFSEALEQLRGLQITESDELWSRMRAAIVEAAITSARGLPGDALQLIDRSIAQLPDGELFWRGRLQLEAARALAALGSPANSRARATEARRLLAEVSDRWRAVEVSRRLRETEEFLARLS